MTYASTTGHRGAIAAILAVAGAALAVATWIGGNHALSLGLVALYAAVSVFAYLWAGRDSDVGAIMRVGVDERQRRIDHDATGLAGLAMGLTAFLGALVSAARNHGDLGGYGLICFVGGLTYAVSLLVLKRRG